MKKIFVFIIILLTPLLLISNNNSPSVSISYNFGLVFVGQKGNNSEYQQSVNPFPLTPAHKVLSVGGAISINLYKQLFLGLNIEYSMNKKLTLIDPSDNDELIVDSLDFYNFYIDLHYDFTIFKFNSFISTGIGKNFTKGLEEEWTTTKSGYDVFLPAVIKRTSPLFIIKGGIMIPVSSSFKFFIENSLIYLTNEKKIMNRLAAGLSFAILQNYR